jgi:protein-tyrosine-phosphatase
MAEAIASHIAADVMEASSAGLTPLGRVELLATETLVRNGYRPDGLESKGIALEATARADLIINMSGWPKEIAFDEPAKVENWQVEDPYGADAELYQRIFEDIEKRVAELADRLRNGGPAGARAGTDMGKGSDKS